MGLCYLSPLLCKQTLRVKVELRNGYKKRMRKGTQKIEIRFLILLSPLAVWTGLEPATPCVTGRYSNQLNYHTIFFGFLLTPVGEASASLLLRVQS